MLTEVVLTQIWTKIQTFGGVRFTSTVKTKLDQERDITINFSLPAEPDEPLLEIIDDFIEKESSENIQPQDPETTK